MYPHKHEFYSSSIERDGNRKQRKSWSRRSALISGSREPCCSRSLTTACPFPACSLWWAISIFLSAGFSMFRSGKDLSPELFGKVPITFDLNRLNLNNAHKRGSERPKVVIVEYGDYGCQSCAKLEKVWQPLLDNFPDVQHVYKHFPLSDGSRYLAEIAEAVSLHDQSKFWEIHQRFMSADKSNWDETETRRFAQAPTQTNWPRSGKDRSGAKKRRTEQAGERRPSGISGFPNAHAYR